ncbi:hypothetical protein BC936DRAFT_137562 [Jimgerdemannia flammicorona]|uniref:CTLH domain-containing protein n=1 Tax=Jimgerdemannia flammicorona TaxID=994334 RepID=A0A433CX29_9FUNG|nr:hypothetical protein BC936DRAFT_137562 [Jimgerdemannia flammicorona]
MDPFSDQYNQITFPEPDLIARKLVLQYLLHNCYGDTAKAFLADISNIQPSSDRDLTLSILANGSGKRHNGHCSTAYVESTGVSTASLKAADLILFSPNSTSSTTLVSTPTTVATITEIATNQITTTEVMDVDNSAQFSGEEDAEMAGTQDDVLSHDMDGVSPQVDIDSLTSTTPTAIAKGIGAASSTFSRNRGSGNWDGSGVNFEGLLKATEQEEREWEEWLPEHWENLKLRKLFGTLTQPSWVTYFIEIHQAITTGSIPAALSLLSSHYPALLSIDPSSPMTTSHSIAISFKLHCQQFIETVRRGLPMEALSFAQSTLGGFPHLDPKMEQRYTDMLTDVTALIAYTKPENSPVGSLLGQDYREKVAEEVNNAVLALCGLRQISTIERIVKQATVVRDIYATQKDKQSNAKVSNYSVLS